MHCKKPLSHKIATAIIAILGIILVAVMFQTVSYLNEQKYLAQEGSGTCYRVAAEHSTDTMIQGYARDRFLTRAECTQIYYMVDRQDIVDKDFTQQKLDALRKIARAADK